MIVLTSPTTHAHLCRCMHSLSISLTHTHAQTHAHTHKGTQIRHIHPGRIQCRADWNGYMQSKESMSVNLGWVFCSWLAALLCISNSCIITKGFSKCQRYTWQQAGQLRVHLYMQTSHYGNYRLPITLKSSKLPLFTSTPIHLPITRAPKGIRSRCVSSCLLSAEHFPELIYCVITRLDRHNVPKMQNFKCKVKVIKDTRWRFCHKQLCQIPLLCAYLRPKCVLNVYPCVWNLCAIQCSHKSPWWNTFTAVYI